METSCPPLLENLKKKLTHLFKIRYALPFVHLVFILMFWQQSTHCFTRISIINFVIIGFLSFSPTSLIQFDYLTVVLFFLWIFKNDNSETAKEDPTCLDPQNNLFWNFSLWFFKFAIWTLTAFMIIIVIFLMISLIREFLMHPAFQGPGLPEDVINNLPLLKYKEYIDPNSQHKKKEDICPICLELFKPEEDLRMIPNCEHVYHINCIKTWLDGNTICPYCRGEVSSMNNSSSINNTRANRSTFAANILNQLQEMSLISDLENQGSSNQQPLMLNRR